MKLIKPAVKKSANLYEKFFINKPLYGLCLIVFILAVCLFYLPRFYLDASSDSLVMDGDKSYKFYQKIRKKYGADDCIIITYTPRPPFYLQIIKKTPGTSK
jgi:hypothetical protein